MERMIRPWQNESTTNYWDRERCVDIGTNINSSIERHGQEKP